MKVQKELEMQMDEVTDCPYCKSKQKTLLFESYDRLYRFPEKFSIFKCEECDLIRLSPRPRIEQMGKYYPERYGAYRDLKHLIHTKSSHQPMLHSIRESVRNTVLSSLGYHDRSLSFFQRFSRPIIRRMFLNRTTYGYGEKFPKYVANGKALEIGCGNGQFLGFLKKHNWAVVGIDLSEYAAQRAKELFDIDVFVGPLEASPFPDESFDYIHLSHVFEHFYDPLESLNKLKKLLKKGGRAYIEVPNANSVGARLSKRYWYGWDPPRHLFSFTPDTLAMTIERSGLKIERMRTTNWNSFDWAGAFKIEDARGEMISDRPPDYQREKLKIFGLNSLARITVALTRKFGENIRCWVVKN